MLLLQMWYRVSDLRNRGTTSERKVTYVWKIEYDFLFNNMQRKFEDSRYKDRIASQVKKRYHVWFLLKMGLHWTKYTSHLFIRSKLFEFKFFSSGNPLLKCLRSRWKENNGGTENSTTSTLSKKTTFVSWIYMKGCHFEHRWQIEHQTSILFLFFMIKTSTL